MTDLPNKLYSVDSVVQLEQVAIKQYDIPAYELMKRAGETVYEVLKNRYPQRKKILVLCGAGNNAGDGYVLAKLAKQDGYDIRVASLIDPLTLENEALLAYQDWLAVAENDAANTPSIDSSLIETSEVIVDALLGTGLTRQVSAEWKRWIDAVNGSMRPVVSVDIPSGLFADTGAIAGAAINADITVSFIGLKQGMFTAQANDVCGEIIFSDLGLPEEAYSQVKSDVLLVKEVDRSILVKRKPSSHKGCFGHVLIAGGNTSMPGAVILAARAALRAGAGLVTIVTVAQHLSAISAAVPEAMVKVCMTTSTTGADEGAVEYIPSVDGLFEQSFIDEISHVAVGMGLGQDGWSLSVLQHCVQLQKPILIDADALNLMAKHKQLVSDFQVPVPLVITPHPGEAARLLSTNNDVTTVDIQSDRFTTVKKLHALFSEKACCTTVLKGSGTLVYDGEIIKVCNLGSAAMAAPGMGDVLSGIIIGLMAQNLGETECELSGIVTSAVCLHASAAELMAGDKTRGLLASDVIDCLPKVL